MRFLPRRSIGLVALIGSFSCICLFGCGKGSGDVSGTVTYKGERLKGGTVTFSSASGGPSFTSPIAEDGTYTLHSVESGEYKVCVETESLKPRTAAGPSMGRGPGGKGSPPGGGGPPDVLKDFKSGKIKAGPPGGSEEPEDFGPSVERMDSLTWPITSSDTHRSRPSIPIPTQRL